jgi:tetratricopeptide (TPR) repeat protein
MISERRMMSTSGDSKKQNMTKNRSRVSLIIISAVLIVSVLFWFIAIPPIKYANASTAFDAQDYDKAISIFSSLKNYRDSTEQLNESQYQKAKELITHRQYIEAVSILSTLDNYKDSPALLSNAEELNAKEMKYQQAYKYLAQGKYELAITFFTEIGDYKDSKNLLYKANEIFMRLITP